MRFTYLPDSPEQESCHIFELQIDYMRKTEGEVTTLCAEAQAWCVEQFGDRGARWWFEKHRDDQWATTTRATLPAWFKFMQDEDAFAFKMRWG